MNLTEKQDIYNFVKKYGIKLMLEEIALAHIEIKGLK